jgi:predicted ABC-type ATPase
MNQPPVVYMIAGPNGAGKTTLALRTLPEFFSIHEFVNADEIARGLSPFNPDDQAVPAGRLMLKRIDDLIAARTNFAFETTGASRVFADKIKQAKAAGYGSGLFYVYLSDADIAKKRVHMRVLQGGHNIPDDTIERRYFRSLHNLVNLYLPLADKAGIYNGEAAQNSRQRIIADKQGKNFRVYLPRLWSNIERMATKEFSDARD